MALKLSDHHFLGEHPIMVIDFLTRFAREANIQEISKAQALVALPSLPKGFAKNQYDAGAEMVCQKKAIYTALQRPYNTFADTTPSRQESVP